jgi:hypothetical protein
MIRNETLGTSIILCTDRQVPKLDNTFPHIYNYCFYVEAWMMAKSSFVQSANPMSTIGVVIHFRQSGLQQKQKGSKMRPAACCDD